MKNIQNLFQLINNVVLKLNFFNRSSNSINITLHELNLILQSISLIIIVMISTLLIIVAASWLVLSILAYFFAKKTFKKYRNYPRMEVASNMGPALRADFGKWDEAAIIKGCFIRFPLHFFMMVSFLGTYGILGTLQKFLKYPDYVIDFFRSRYGRLNTSICLNLVEEFDPKVPVSTPIIIANHVSWIDFIYMGTCLSRSSFVAKIEVKKVPVFGDIANYLKALYVDRSSPQARGRIKDQILQRTKEFQQDAASSSPLIIYPEGTVTNGRSIISFMNGAFEPMCPITIIVLKYECKEFHMGLDEVTTVEHGMLSLCLTPTLRVFKQVVKPQTNQTVELYRERCRQIVAQKGGFKKVDLNFKELVGYEKTFMAFLKEKKNAAINRPAPTNQ